MGLEQRQKRGDGGLGGDASVHGDNSFARGGNAGDAVVGSGGHGGRARVQGDNSVAVGGGGGRGGISEGGRGGDAEAIGDNVAYAGGEGGEANQPDGRGGRGGRNGHFTLYGQDFQLPDGRWISEFGRGGDGAHSPRYRARMMVIEEILGKDILRHPLRSHVVAAGIIDLDTYAAVMEHLNNQLGGQGRSWRVRVTDGCFEFYEP
jgi:hypothetical protein